MYHCNKLLKKLASEANHPIVDDIMIYYFLSAQSYWMTSRNYLIYMVYPAAYNSKSLLQLGLCHMYMNGLLLTNRYKCLSHRCKDTKLLWKIIQYFSDFEARTDLLLCNTELYAVFIAKPLKSSKLVLYWTRSFLLPDF